MNKKTITSILLALFTMAGWAQVQTTTALTGSWSGKLEAGQMSLTLVFHLEQADGFVKITMDSPDQSVKGIPVKKECLTDDSLAVKVEALGLMYQARLKDGKLDGTFTQMGFSAPLVLARGTDEVKRPQNPQQDRRKHILAFYCRDRAAGSPLRSRRGSRG